MKPLYERLTKLLNEPHDGPVFREFLTDQAQEPIITQITGDFIYEFCDLGISLDTLSGRFACVVMHLRKSNMQPYCGDFPCDIKSGDVRDVVQQKLGIQPNQTERQQRDSSDCDSYDLPNLRIHFYFSRRKGRMLLVSIHPRRVIK